MTGGRLSANTVDFDLVVMGGTLAPGDSPGTTTINGNYEQQAAGTLEIEIGGTTAGSEFDMLAITGSTTLAGTLDVSLFDLGGGLFSPSAGDTFEILTAAGGLAGAFDTLNLPALPGDLLWFVNYGATSVELVTTFNGDLDFDGLVNALDAGTMFTNWGQVGLDYADGNIVSGGLGAIDAADAGAMFANWTGDAGPTTNTIPEPTSAVLLGVGVLAMIAARRRIVRR